MVCCPPWKKRTQRLRVKELPVPTQVLLAKSWLLTARGQVLRDRPHSTCKLEAELTGYVRTRRIEAGSLCSCGAVQHLL